MSSPSFPSSPRSSAGRRSPRLVRISAVAAATLLAVVLAGCGSSEDSPARGSQATQVTATPVPSGSPMPAPDATAVTVPIQITADSVTPDGTRIEAKRSQPVVLQIQAEQAGELHVHSTPEQEISFPAGASTVELSFDQPGVIDVEDHHLDALIIQLEVS